tara:strand:- start:669 stop:1406 length:738 start_codon:yes stop_codon:yes gene_type:complete
MEKIHYKRPPITEAVIQFVFKSKADNDKIAKAVKKLETLYDKYELREATEYKFEISPTKEPVTSSKVNPAHEFSSNDRTDVTILRDDSLLCSAIAPYKGWDEFVSRFERDWKIWRKIVGYKEVEKIGLRYINRIDIPADNPIVRYEDYINVFPHVPSVLEPNSYFSINMQVPLLDIHSLLNIKTAIVKSPVPKHLALILDLDVVKTFDAPNTDDAYFKYLEAAHTKKNEIFEASIKDKSRELFQK